MERNDSNGSEDGDQESEDTDGDGDSDSDDKDSDGKSGNGNDDSDKINVLARVDMFDPWTESIDDADTVDINEELIEIIKNDR